MQTVMLLVAEPTMMTGLFILSIAVFVYLLYVLIKPEKF